MRKERKDVGEQLKLWKDEETSQMVSAERFEELSHALMLAQEALQELHIQHNLVRRRLEEIEPVYKRLYNNKWIRRLFDVPCDPVLEQRTLMRCRTCHGLFWKDGPEEFTTHKGHRYSVADVGTEEEWKMLKRGKIK